MTAWAILRRVVVQGVLVVALAGCLSSTTAPDPGPPKEVWAVHGDQRQLILTGPVDVLDRDGEWRQAYRYLHPASPINQTVYFDGGFRKVLETFDCKGIDCSGVEARWYGRGTFHAHPIGLPYRVAHGYTEAVAEGSLEPATLTYDQRNRYLIEWTTGHRQSAVFSESDWVATFEDATPYAREDGNTMTIIEAWPMTSRFADATPTNQGALPGMSRPIFEGGDSLANVVEAIQEDHPWAAGECLARASIFPVHESSEPGTLVLEPSPKSEQSVRVTTMSQQGGRIFSVTSQTTDGQTSYEVNADEGSQTGDCALLDSEVANISPQDAIQRWSRVLGFEASSLRAVEICTGCRGPSQASAPAGFDYMHYSLHFEPRDVTPGALFTPARIKVDAYTGDLEAASGIRASLIARG